MPKQESGNDEKEDKDTKKEIVNNYFFGSVILITFAFIYHHYH